MSEIITVGLDLAKNVFQVHGADGAGRGILRSCVFRGHPATDSESIRPPIPILSGHRFRGIRPPCDVML